MTYGFLPSGLWFPTYTGFPDGLDGEESTCNAGDPGSISRLGRSSAEGNGNLLQYSCLENSKDREAWQATVHGVTKSWTRLSDWLTHTSCCPGFHVKKERMEDSKGRGSAPSHSLISEEARPSPIAPPDHSYSLSPFFVAASSTFPSLTSPPKLTKLHKYQLIFLGFVIPVAITLFFLSLTFLN